MTRQTRVGLLVLLGILVFVVGLFVLAGRTFLFSDVFVVRTEFSRVAGLTSGANVQYQGVNVGRVRAVQLPQVPGGKITVEMLISENARHLVRANTQAQIKTDGLVGNMIVVLVSPPEVDEPVEEGAYIAGIDPFDLFEISDRALESVQGFEAAAQSFEQIMLDIQNGEGTLGKFIYDPALYDGFVATTEETQTIMRELSNSAESIVGLAGRATGGLESILAKVDEGDGTLSLLLNDPAVYNSFLATADTLQQISGDLRSITNSADNAAYWAALGSYRFAELMEAGKQNFLFKRYFEERGYMEKADFEVRERALSETYKELQTEQRRLFQWQQRLEALEQQMRDAGIEPGTSSRADTSAAPTASSAPDGR